MSTKKPARKKPLAQKKPSKKLYILTRSIGNKDIAYYDGIFESEKEVKDCIDQMDLANEECVEVFELKAFKTYQLVTSLKEIKNISY